MAQVTNETTYGEINVYDVMPNGGVVLEKKTDPSPYGDVVSLRITYLGNRAVWYGAMYANKPYGEAVADSNARHSDLAYGD